MLIDIVKKINKVEPNTKEILLDILNEIENQRKQFENQVTKVEFNELKNVVKDLVEAQKRTEEKLGELTEAQKKTEQRLEELAGVQKETEKRMSSLEKKMEELAEAQKKTEIVVKGLVKDMSEVKTRLEGLSDTVGYGLEDKLIPFMPDFVKNNYGCKVKLVDRKNIIYPNGKFDEINLYIEAEKQEKTVIIIGECKSKPGKRDIKKFIKLKERISKHFKNKEIKGFIVGYNFHPEVEEYLKEIKEIDYFKTFEIERIAKNNLI